MADVLAGIRLVSTADVTGVKSMSAALSAFGGELKTQEKQFSGLNKVSAGFMAVGLAIEAGLGFAATQSLEYENLINRFAVTSRLTADGVQQIHDRMLTLSSSMNVSAESLARLSVEAGRLGLDASGVERFVMAGVKLAAISGGAITAEGAITRLAEITKVFHINMVDGADKIASAFVGLARNTTITESELAQLVSRTAELGKEAGFNIQQIAALGATAKDLGLDGRRAAGAMEGLFHAMTNATSMRAFARQVHMTGYAFRQALDKDPTEILLKLGNSFQGLGKRLTEARLTKMGITDAAQRTLVLGLAEGTDKFSKNLMIANEEFKKGTAANESYQQLLGSTRMALDVFKNALHAVAISFGEILLPPLRFALQIGIAFLQLVLAIPTPIKAIVVVGAALAAGFFIVAGSLIIASVAVYSFISALATQVIAMIASTQAALTNVAALIGLNAEMVLNASLFLASIPVVGAFAAELMLLVGQLFLGEIGLAGFTAGLIGLIGAAVTFEMVTGIGEVLLIVAAAVGVLYVAWKALKPVFTELWNSLMLLGEPFRVLADAFSEIAAMFGTGGSGFGGIFLAFVRVALFPVILIVKGIANQIRLIASILTGVARAFVALVKPLIAPFAALYNFVLKAVESVADLFNGFVDSGGQAVSVFEGVADAAGFFFKWLTPIGLGLQYLGSVFDALGFVGRSVFDGILDALDPLIVVLRGVGQDIVAAFEPIRSAFNDLMQPFRDIMQEWLGITEGGLGFGRMVSTAIRVMVRGVLAPFVLVLQSVASVIGVLIRSFMAMAAAWVRAVDFMLTPLTFFLQGVTDMAASVIATVQAIPNAIRKVWDGLVGIFTDLAPRILDSLAGAFEGILRKIAGVVQAASKSAINQMIDPVNTIVGAVNKVLPKKLEIPSIPKLGDGAVAVRPTLAMIGEGPEPEAVMPLSRLSALLAAGPQASVPATQTRGSTGSPESGGGSVRITIPVSVMLDGLEIGRAVAEVTEDQIRRQFGAKKLRFSGVS